MDSPREIDEQCLDGRSLGHDFSWLRNAKGDRQHVEQYSFCPYLSDGEDLLLIVAQRKAVLQLGALRNDRWIVLLLILI